jgi:hypothetical protein
VYWRDRWPVEDADGAALVAVAASGVALIHSEGLGGEGDLAAVLEQGGLVVLDLDDQRDFGLGCAFEQFFGSAVHRV